MNSLTRERTTSTEPLDRDAKTLMSGKGVFPATEQNRAPISASPLGTELNGYPARDQTESLFEQVAWLYVFCREKLFRDDTDRISAALWPEGAPLAGTKMIELGCGPGFYSCRFASRFPQLAVVGVDRSDRQLTWARERAQAISLANCHFERVNVLDIPCDDSSFDVLIASRLFTVLPEREEAIAEMHRVLRPGGRCFIAEPRHAFRASVPLVAMWMLARATHFHKGYREPRKAVTLAGAEFRRLFATQPWRECRCWQDSRYQYALCEKA
ncbi:MAG: methyltransferase domain-containing protein [Chthoniobacterales bacterium]